MEFLKDSNYDFVSKRFIMFVVSGVFLVIGIASVVFHGGLKYSVDFAGGSVLWLRFDLPVTTEDIRETLSVLGEGSSEIQMLGRGFQEGSSTEVIIKTAFTEDGTSLMPEVKRMLSETMPDNPYEVLDEEFVGPKIGGELKVKAIKAIFLSLQQTTIDRPDFKL